MKRNYLSYLLRIWDIGNTEFPNWVASLEDPHSHKVIYLDSLEALTKFLQQSINVRESSEKPNGKVEKKKIG
ncbi:MAG: hypothetical protein CVU39_16465 [Chloroflexi bacterium HGW-Chloroflexi-10]|nr:MAG: hypothetical protein CVU39_16465 [Chloroflexi bacterium HGW-Chloroflexi-10]